MRPVACPPSRGTTAMVGTALRAFAHLTKWELQLNPRELAMAEEARSRLGRGLASLIGDVGGEAAHLERPRGQPKGPSEFIKTTPRNRRRAFSENELRELADSIRQHGVIQPIAVRPVKG